MFSHLISAPSFSYTGSSCYFSEETSTALKMARGCPKKFDKEVYDRLCEVCGKQPMNDGKERTDGGILRPLEPTPEEALSPVGLSTRAKKSLTFNPKRANENWQKTFAMKNLELKERRINQGQAQMNGLLEGLKDLTSSLKTILEMKMISSVAEPPVVNATPFSSDTEGESRKKARVDLSSVID